MKVVSGWKPATAACRESWESWESWNRTVPLHHAMIHSHTFPWSMIGRLWTTGVPKGIMFSIVFKPSNHPCGQYRCAIPLDGKSLFRKSSAAASEIPLRMAGSLPVFEAAGIVASWPGETALLRQVHRKLFGQGANCNPLFLRARCVTHACPFQYKVDYFILFHPKIIIGINGKLVIRVQTTVYQTMESITTTLPLVNQL